MGFSLVTIARSFIITGSVLALAACGRTGPTNVSLCEDAIKSTLKAPSTYRRVSVDNMGGPRHLTFEYDAQNSFGVPLRGYGYCDIDGSMKAHWLEIDRGAPNP